MPGADVERFIVPPLDGALSGGTLLNRHLLRALERCGLALETIGLERGRSLLASGAPGRFWIDSLFLDAFPELLALRVSGQRLGVLLHYLPTLVARGDQPAPADLSAGERAALTGADIFLVPSASLRNAARRLGAARQPILLVEPGLPRIDPAGDDPRTAGVRALLVGNLLPAKGLHPLLLALVTELRDSDRFELSVAGGSALDAAYAERCAELVARHPILKGRVSLRGEVPPAELVACFAASNLFVSASVHESYGMALAEARVAGLPLLAHAGGHTRVHAQADAGGELVSSHTELARACVRLARDPLEHARRLELARAHRYAPRSWETAAREFLEQLAQCTDAAALP